MAASSLARPALAALAILIAAGAAPARAQNARVEILERRLAQQQERIERLESLIEKQVRQPERFAAPAPVPAPLPAVAQVPAPAPSTAPARSAIAGLDASGDLRVREEFNFSDADGRGRTRTALRARVRAAYLVTDRITAGVQIATGDPDDPNSADISLTGFDDDLEVSLDQAWMRYQSGGFTAYAGKFPQIFQRTDMVWDGDVSPTGLGGVYALPLGGGAQLDARAMYFAVDEAAGGPDSRMLGGQAVLAVPLSSSLKLSLAGGYYDYALNSLAGADAGDFRTNLMAGGRYLSGFRLVEGLATLSWSGLGERWPVTLTGDYVRNLGAAVPSDSGFNLELAAGRAAKRGDWRIFYGYSEVGVDAVFAAFSHDNINLATNYRLHGVGLGYVPTDNVFLDAIFYHYRPLDALYAAGNQPHDWLDRMRLNLMVTF